MKKSILLLMSVGLMIAISPGFASGPSVQNKEGPDVRPQKESVIVIEKNMFINQPEAIVLMHTPIQVAEYPAFTVVISPVVVIVKSANLAARYAGYGVLGSTCDPKKSVIPRCRSFDCL